MQYLFILTAFSKHDLNTKSLCFQQKLYFITFIFFVNIFVPLMHSSHQPIKKILRFYLLKRILKTMKTISNCFIWEDEYKMQP